MKGKVYIMHIKPKKTKCIKNILNMEEFKHVIAYSESKHKIIYNTLTFHSLVYFINFKKCETYVNYGNSYKGHIYIILI